MNTNGSTSHFTTLAEVLTLSKKIYNVGWRLVYELNGEDNAVHYRLIKFSASARGFKRAIELSFDKFDLACGVAALLEASHKKKVISGSPDMAPPIEASLAIRNRLDRHGCMLRGVMDFDRMTIGYRITIDKQVLLFNAWDAVVEFANYLDQGAPGNSLSPPETDDLTAKEEIEA